MRGMNSESVDLIYLDPPFNSNTNYAAPIGSEAAGAEFKDTWTLNDIDIAWLDLIEAKHPKLWRVIQAAMTDSDKSYLIYMAVRLLEMKRLLKRNGLIYLHCDPTMSHYLKLVMDATFGKKNFLNELVWHYSNRLQRKRKPFAKLHDVIFICSNSDDFTANALFDQNWEPSNTQQRRLSKGYEVRKGVLLVYDEKKRKEAEQAHPDLISQSAEASQPPLGDVWDIPILNPMAKERTGYRTQKPLALLQRIIKASCPEDGIVFDPFCGCATTCVAAEIEGREWVGIDIGPKAYDLVKARLDREIGLSTFKTCINRTDIPQRTDIVPLKKYNHPDNKKYLYGEQGGICNGCKEHFLIQNFTVDHIIPQKQGGTDHLDNLQLLCGYCNSVKGDRGQEYLVAKLAA